MCSLIIHPKYLKHPTFSIGTLLILICCSAVFKYDFWWDIFSFLFDNWFHNNDFWCFYVLSVILINILHLISYFLINCKLSSGCLNVKFLLRLKLVVSLKWHFLLLDLIMWVIDDSEGIFILDPLCKLCLIIRCFWRALYCMFDWHLTHVTLDLFFSSYYQCL